MGDFLGLSFIPASDFPVWDTCGARTEKSLVTSEIKGKSGRSKKLFETLSGSQKQKVAPKFGGNDVRSHRRPSLLRDIIKRTAQIGYKPCPTAADLMSSYVLKSSALKVEIYSSKVCASVVVVVVV